MRSASFLILVALFLLGSCAGSGSNIAYYNHPSGAKPPATDPQTIDFYVSTLDSIHPYVHIFPTGMRTVAPTLDTRGFVSPDSLLARIVKARGDKQRARCVLGVPSRAYVIVGEVGCPLGDQQHPLREHELVDHIAPNSLPYIEVANVDWGFVERNLRNHAADMGADAVIEIFAGKGTALIWAAPTVLPVGPSLLDGGGPRPSAWALQGLAIHWTDADDGKPRQLAMR